MLHTIYKSIFLLFSLLIIVCGIYPFSLWVVGQTFFPFQANGSIVFDKTNHAIGSTLIAQAFTQDEYFQPRPSAASYNAAASSSSALAVSNYALRDRVARSVGLMVKYANGQPVAPDMLHWFQQDSFQGKPHLVASWATFHPALATAWIDADPLHSQYVDHWAKEHPAIIAEFIKNNPTLTHPSAEDLTLLFFQTFSTENPGQFPLANEKEIQTIFFDMWRQDHPDVALQWIPGDLVTTSASGLDPHITLQSAEYQLDRVAVTWAAKLKRNPNEVKQEIEQLLQANASAPFRGLAGEKLINVLEVNLALTQRYAAVSVLLNR